jgi:hypothetical protein
MMDAIRILSDLTKKDIQKMRRNNIFPKDLKINKPHVLFGAKWIGSIKKVLSMN